MLRDPARLAALRRTALLDSRAEAAFDRLTRLATGVLGVPVALVSLVEEDRQFFKSCVGLPEPWATARETPLSHSFCQHVVGTGEPLIVRDARAHPLVRDNPAIRDLNVAAYAGMPLVVDGHVLGSFCAIDTQPRQWTARDVAILADLASLVLTEIELRTQVVERERATRLRDEVLAVVAHDLRNPLQALMTAAEVLARPGVKEEARQRQAAAIVRTGQGMSRLVADLLDVASIEQGRLSVRPTRVPVREMLEAAYDEHDTRATAVGVSLALDAHALPDVRADGARAAQVLANLLDNALRATPRGGTVTLGASATEGSVRFEVTDTGPGIPEADRGHVFEQFWQGGASPGRAGLGLAIVRGIVEAHGGRVGTEPRPDGGTRFWFTLPTAGSDDPVA